VGLLFSNCSGKPRLQTADGQKKPITVSVNYAAGDLSYAHSITWDINCDIDLEHTWVPSLMIQPIVENAVIHGIKPKGSGHINIDIERKGKNIHVKVRDDGIGMSREDVNRLKTLLDLSYEN